MDYSKHEFACTGSRTASFKQSFIVSRRVSLFVHKFDAKYFLK